MNTLGFTRQDGRNLLIIAAIVAVITAVRTAEPLGVRLAAGVLAGLISGTVFVVSTVVIGKFTA